MVAGSLSDGLSLHDLVSLFLTN